MTKDEAMKLALEVLHYCEALNRAVEQQKMQAITALKQALEQPEPEPVALPEKIYEFVPTPEPAKWHHPECEGQCLACLIEQVVQEAYGSQGLGYLQRHLTTPPQREWQGLTDEEIDEGQRQSWVEKQAFESAVWWAEAKLKEKNG